MTLRVEMLPARFGDALLVTWGSADGLHHMLIDAGLASVYPAVARRLRELDCDLDLFVITHIDVDHIAGAVKLLGDDELAPRIREVWFNGYRHLEQVDDLLGALDGERLTDLIEARRLPWNRSWPHPVSDAIGGPVVRPDDDLPVVELAGGATVTLLSPTADKLRALLHEWTEVIENAGLKKGVDATPEQPEPDHGSDLLGGTLEDLANARFKRDNKPANGSSIAFLFEYDGKRILFGADAHEEVLLDALRLIGDEPLEVDAVKLPHHGSRANVSKDLVRALESRQWWFSSNGVSFHHPNDEAIARVILHGGRRPTLVGNYRSDRWTAFTAEYPPEDHEYELVLPNEGSEGVTIELAR